MPTEIKMPQLGESVTEGTIGRWLKRPGEHVEKYEPLLEVTTDKVDTEVPAPEAGVLRSIAVPEGQTVKVGTLLAVLDSEGNGVAAPAPAATPAPAAAHDAATAPGAQGFVSPVVARLAAEHNLDRARVAGTGQGGRITKQDVLKYIEARATAAPAAPAPAVPPPAPVQATPAPAAAPAASAPATIPDDAEIIPVSSMRRSIAEHMVVSRRTAPHVTTVFELDVSRIAAHRERRKADFARQGVKLTFTPYFVQAAVAALQAVPMVNGSYSEQGIVLNRRINVGVAVALDEGLIVPVLRDADEKNLLGLARAVNDLAERARTRRLKPDETRDGTFTITNHGVSGSLFATPIINQPQAAIMGIGAIQKRAVVISQGGVDAIAIRPMCYVSLTIDHRLLDGASADAFLQVVKTAIEGFEE
ncbi:dehydrogenase [Kouleothrix aurantiaca]|uniref:Dihydrolipoamide acetyltransferase component of pyruvate dehydrogenase complex n=1 Tax=Kouleothrix aurantiaca TaxID=186479 RepID=A0A0P9CW34_9CHLR|nr:dehydrogenase [Kouleothrix aurantiaca]